jgi:hypothetical protein
VDIQGLEIGPLIFGEIRSVATETRKGDGTIVPSSSMYINGVQIGGFPIGMSDTGFTGAPGSGPKQLNEAFASMLKGSGQSVTVVAAQAFPTAVVAPTIQISGPLQIPGLTTAPGTYTINIGAATASVQGSGTAPANIGTVQGGTADLGAGALGPAPSIAGTENFTPSGLLPQALPAVQPLPGQAPEPATRQFVPAAQVTAQPAGFEIDGLYRMLLLGALVAGASVAIIGRLGVSKP